MLDEEEIFSEENHNNEEEEQQHKINYATSLPIEFISQARHRKRCNQPGRNP